jgi:hypothetical protein
VGSSQNLAICCNDHITGGSGLLTALVRKLLPTNFNHNIIGDILASASIKILGVVLIYPKATLALHCNFSSKSI